MRVERETKEIEDLGFRRGRIAECLVTTYHPDGTPNAAPMGIRTLANGDLEMRVHRDTDTHSNLRERRACAVNLVYDPYLLLRAALTGRGAGSGEREVAEGETEKSSSVDAPYLRSARAVLEVEVVELDESSRDPQEKWGFSRVRGRVKKIRVLNPLPSAPNRGFHAAIELAIDLSRGKRERWEEHLTVMRKTLEPREMKRIEAFLRRLEGPGRSSPGPSLSPRGSPSD
jgi:hypothetical protein